MLPHLPAAISLQFVALLLSLLLQLLLPLLLLLELKLVQRTERNAQNAIEMFKPRHQIHRNNKHVLSWPFLAAATH